VKIRRGFVLTAIKLLVAAHAMGPTRTEAITDFGTWTQVQDPAHPGMSGRVDNASQITLSASGAVPAATDIGYQSVDGPSAAAATGGHYFSAGESFHVAIDYDVIAASSVGLAALGFGVGEDAEGRNSAGPALAVDNGNPLAFSGGARVNDVTQPPVLFGPAATSSGRFFVRYDAASGDVVFGVNATQGTASPTHSNAFSGIQNSWNGNGLLVSFFLRSDSAIFPPLSSGTIDAVFSNFEVLEGTPVAAAPEPISGPLLWSAVLLSQGLWLREGFSRSSTGGGRGWRTSRLAARRRRSRTEP